MKIPPPDLKDLYDKYNAKYFEGLLPAIPVLWSTPSDKSHAAEFWHEPMQIVVHPSFKRLGLYRYVKMLLLHEMTHVKLRNEKIADHGRRFEYEMRRLANAGAFKNLW